MNRNMGTRKGGRSGLILIVALMLVLALVPLSETVTAYETLGYSVSISAQMPDSMDAAEDALFAGLMWATPRDMSDHVRLDMLSVYAEDGAELYRYAPVVVTKIELSRTEKLSFALEWSADEDEDFQIGDYFTFAIMQCEYFSEVGTEIPIEGNDIVTATGEFNCVNGVLTCTVAIKSLAPGYTLTEGTASGWVKLNADEDETGTEIRFQDGQFHEFEFKNSNAGGTINAKPQTGEIVFIKSDYQDGDKTGIIDESRYESLTGLADIPFTVYEQGNDTPLRLWKTDDGYYLSAEKPDKAVEATETDTIKTNSDGIFKLIFVGEYLKKEYYLVEDLTDLSGYFSDQNQYVPFTPDRNRGIYYAIYNVPRTIRLKKTDADSGKALAGVEFALYDSSDDRIEGFRRSESDGCYIYDGVGTDALKTDENGFLELRQLPARDRDSSYYFVEVAPLDGYLPNDNRYVFTIKQTLDSTEPDNALIVVENVRYPSVALIKQGVRNSQSYVLSDVSFTLFSNELGYSTTKTTDQDGRLVFDNLPDLFAGTYTLRESTPVGYEGVGDITIVIGQDGRIARPVWDAREDGKISWNASERCLTIRNHTSGGNGGSSSGDDGSSSGSSSGESSNSSGGGSSGGGHSSGRDDYSGGSFTGGSSFPRDTYDRGTSDSAIPLTTIVDDEIPAAAMPDTPNAQEGIPSTGGSGMVGKAVLIALVTGAAMVWNFTRAKR